MLFRLLSLHFFVVHCVVVDRVVVHCVVVTLLWVNVPAPPPNLGQIGLGLACD